jgi:DUF218 domain
MSEGVATSIIVFGRGLRADGADISLSEASRARVRALVDYVEANRSIFGLRPAKVIFSGGWSAAAAKMKAPPVEFREGTLMLEYAHALSGSDSGFSACANSAIEIESNSTLENVLRTKEAGYFSNSYFTAVNPLGIVAHVGHEKRIEYFMRKIFGLPNGSILHITADGADDPDPRHHHDRPLGAPHRGPHRRPARTRRGHATRQKGGDGAVTAPARTVGADGR